MARAEAATDAASPAVARRAARRDIHVGAILQSCNSVYRPLLREGDPNPSAGHVIVESGRAVRVEARLCDCSRAMQLEIVDGVTTPMAA